MKDASHRRRNSRSALVESARAEGLHGADVDVWLVEAVEQDDAVGPGVVELPGHVAEGRVEWGNFHSEGNFQRTFQLADRADQLVLDRVAWNAQVGDDLDRGSIQGRRRRPVR